MSNPCKYTPVVLNETFTTNNSGICTIIDIEGNGTASDYVTVQFQSGFTIRTRVSELRQGQVRDPYTPNVFGVGYLGEGEYKGNKVADAYNAWYAMMTRCYSTATRYATYSECVVSQEWHNFQNFAKWYYANYKEGCSLDKDILGDSKVYGKDTCMYIPAAINAAEAYLRKASSTDGRLASIYDAFIAQVVMLYRDNN